MKQEILQAVANVEMSPPCPRLRKNLSSLSSMPLSGIILDPGFRFLTTARPHSKQQRELLLILGRGVLIRGNIWLVGFAAWFQCISSCK